MSAGRIGCAVTLAQGQAVPPGAEWFGDNGKFGKGWRGRDQFLHYFGALRGIADRCAFIVAPDVPFDMAGTLALSAPYLDDIRGLGFPVALALQNGAEHLTLPWDRFDVAFIGGDDAWKTGHAAVTLTAEATARGLPVHMGRVNTLGRLRTAAGMGCRYGDGTTLTRGADRNLPQMLRWLDALNGAGAQGVLL